MPIGVMKKKKRALEDIAQRYGVVDVEGEACLARGGVWHEGRKVEACVGGVLPAFIDAGSGRCLFRMRMGVR